MLKGITGRKFHGKDTVAREFVAEGWAQMRFADPLKEMLRGFYRCVGLEAAEIERRIEGDLKEATCPYLMGKTPRDAMQTLGTEWGRNTINPLLWVNTLIHRAAVSQADVVVSDVRFLNEATAIRAAGGEVIKVVATDAETIENRFSLHPSETEIDEIRPDHVINNDRKSIDPIRHAVQAMLASRSESL